ncbi:unnamed protein product [Schistosoma mattheei]|uniref:Uncharacterized protein n=1 Tax=Schistosoma mattheei TaxID=31246 RepID=A0A183PKH2_9TREM|nr:unnamed protein product [Schistosoma mattheei]
MDLHRLRWFGHVLRMAEHRLPRRAMLSCIGDGWKKIRGDQTKTWHQCLKTLTSSLSGRKLGVAKPKRGISA